MKKQTIFLSGFGILTGLVISSIMILISIM